MQPVKTPIINAATSLATNEKFIKLEEKLKSEAFATFILLPIRIIRAAIGATGSINALPEQAYI